MRALAILLLPLSSACAAQAPGPGVSDSPIACTVVSNTMPEEERELACRLLSEEIRQTARDDLTALTIEKPSPTSARVSAYTADGQLALSLDFDVMDANLGEPQWRGFARMFARQLIAE